MFTVHPYSAKVQRQAQNQLEKQECSSAHGGVSDKGDKLILKEGVRGFYLKWREHDENTGEL